MSRLTVEWWAADAPMDKHKNAAMWTMDEVCDTVTTEYKRIVCNHDREDWHGDEFPVKLLQSIEAKSWVRDVVVEMDDGTVHHASRVSRGSPGNRELRVSPADESGGQFAVKLSDVAEIRVGDRE